MKNSLKRKTIGIFFTLALLFTTLFSAPFASATGVYAAETATTLIAQGTCVFTFSNSDITVSNGDSDSYKISGTSLTIKSPGTYVVTGSCSKGSIKVKKETTGVTLVLYNLSLSCSDGAPIVINKGNTNTMRRLI